MSNIIIRNGKVLYNEYFIKEDILVSKGKIKFIGKINLDDYSDFKIIDAKDMMLLPGMIDIHTHGGDGVDINHADVQAILDFSDFLASHGVTGYLPTLLTDTHEKMIHILETIAKAKEEQKTGAEILGIHMEGPFLSREFKGAMPGELILDSSIEKMKDYEKASNNLIKYVTIAPENPGAEELIKYLSSKDIVSSIGHSGAEYGACMKCIENGANSATHIFNAMSPIHHHKPSIVTAALESDIFVEIICDGRHLHPGIVRLVIKTKGKNRVVAVSDSIMAGSTLTMDKALTNLMKFTKLGIEDCIPMLSLNPATLLGIQDEKGKIELDYYGDIMILDEGYIYGTKPE